MAGKVIAENRRARFDYFLEQTFEAGIALTGSEVKSLRNGKANIAESYAAVENNEIVLVNADIPTYAQAGPHFNHEPRRHRFVNRGPHHSAARTGGADCSAASRVLAEQLEDYAIEFVAGWGGVAHAYFGQVASPPDGRRSMSRTGQSGDALPRHLLTVSARTRSRRLRSAILALTSLRCEVAIPLTSAQEDW